VITDLQSSSSPVGSLLGMSQGGIVEVASQIQLKSTHFKDGKERKRKSMELQSHIGTKKRWIDD